MKNISSIKTRILEYIDYRGITKYEFYKKSGITRSVLDKDSGISETNIIKFMAYDPRIRLEWLIKGEGDMFEDDAVLNDPASSYKRPVAPRVPVYKLEDTGGLATLFEDQPKPVSHISIPNLSRCDGAVYITGDGMYPYLKSGDIILYKEVQNTPENLIWGELYLMSIDLEGEEYVMVRWLQKSDKGQEYVKLVSKNTDRGDKIIKTDRIKALAMVKASIHFNTMQ